ncbi:septum site-determining protein MinC [Enterovibrio norvegicus]|uniref:Probable septum site-determining protein MinC n=1 Tax=Enterovibrio norvegicus TaxID=188144 RepID=A0A2N7L5A1_9GAMM|nr:septum site-determining protein MinC [Enterovibrio norvegicus]PML80945.1 septum site-determining protein MinC [Enterovibrio norvegicus]PMN67475.1 septum site-determining protein MinC [Enterovibrio norvegicus]PMN88828.1 septum site-determining protein MinC [Enterovibrio norvegicus]
MTKNAELKGSSFTLSVLHLLDDDLDGAMNVLLEKVNQAPAFFDGAPVVVDITRLHRQPNFDALKATIANMGMLVVGITGCKLNSTREAAKLAGLAIMAPAKQSRINDPIQTPTKVVTTPIRSGQQVYAKNADLVILNHVSAGAEIIADGSIHIYGVLRGRAIAGASGQKEAHIFCQNLQSELVSIAGTYWLSEAIPDEYASRPVKVSLQNDSLNIEPLTL